MNEMWEIAFEVRDGENEYTDDSNYFFGEYEDAKRYANSYIQDYWGVGETVCDDWADAYFTKDGCRAVRLFNIQEFNRIVAMTGTDTLTYKLEYSTCRSSRHAVLPHTRPLARAAVTLRAPCSGKRIPTKATSISARLASSNASNIEAHSPLSRCPAHLAGLP